MSSKAKSGMSAVRMFPEAVLQPPNLFTPGDANFISPKRDGRGHAAIHASVTNDTAGTVQILQAWRSAGPFVQVLSVPLAVDPVTGLFVADIIYPVVRRFFQVVFTPAAAPPGLGANFELGIYLLPRADSIALQTAGGGGGGLPVANRPSWDSNQKTVAAPGTPEQLPSMPVPSGFALVVRYLLTNTKPIYVGPTSAKAKKTNNKFTSLSQAGHFIRLFVTNADEVWIDADQAAEGVEFFAEQ